MPMHRIMSQCAAAWHWLPKLGQQSQATLASGVQKHARATAVCSPCKKRHHGLQDVQAKALAHPMRCIYPYTIHLIQYTIQYTHT